MPQNDYGEFDDGQEDNDDLLEITLPAANSHAAILYQWLQESQLQNQELQKQLANQRLLTSSLKADLDDKSRKGQKRNKPIDSTLSPYLNHILLIGKCWTLMHEPWISGDSFMRSPPPNSPGPYTLDQFKDFETYQAGQILELHEYLEDSELKNLAISLPAM
ncbi:hypothetical protein VKT23_018251 [Stygiomarasmius scandens]|uniref:Uncharacterized protein n=1 Tax=Marasmiellus scandens TaxID=2682957 RepID=A0ABR1IU87_9AGAR